MIATYAISDIAFEKYMNLIKVHDDLFRITKPNKHRYKVYAKKPLKDKSGWGIYNEIKKNVKLKKYDLYKFFTPGVYSNYIEFDYPHCVADEFVYLHDERKETC